MLKLNQNTKTKNQVAKTKPEYQTKNQEAKTKTRIPK